MLASPWVRRALLAAIVALGLTLRTLGLRLGLPYGHHWDEGWIVDSISHMLVTHTPVPETYQYGAPMMMLGVATYQAFTHLVHGVSPTDGCSLRWMARGVSVAVSVTGTIAIYLAARWGDWRSGRTAVPALLAALLYATASQLVDHARYGVTDACVIALAAWTLALTARYLRAGHLGWGVAALVAAGVTAGFKITALPIALVPLAAITIVPASHPRLRSTLPYRLLLAAALPIVAGTFVELNPMFVHRDHWNDALRDVVTRVLQTRDGGVPEPHLREPGLPHLAAALRQLASLSLHQSAPFAIALFAVGTFGLARMVRRGSVLFAVAAGHASLAILFMALPNRAFLLRNYLVALPAICLGFGVGAEAIARWLALWSSGYGAMGRLARAAALLATGVVLVALPLHDAIACQALSVDPRQRAVEWILAHARPDASVAYTPSVVGDAAMGQYDGFASTLPRPAVLLRDVRSCADAAASHADYIVTASHRADNNAVAYEDLWFFQECAPYVEVARFEPNPYEHDFAVTAVWNGRTTAIVLALQR